MDCCRIWPRGLEYQLIGGRKISTHDYVISNASGSSVRGDINSALAAILSNNSDSTEPSTTQAYMLWADTSNNLLKIRNSSNNGWITIGSTNTANLGLALLAGCTFTGEVVFNSTGSIQLPAGSTAQRPGSPTNGDIRYNNSDHQVEAYKNGNWQNVGSGAGSTGGNNGLNAIFWENEKVVTHDYTITANRNAGSFGPITVNSGITVTTPGSSTWTIV